MWWESTSSSVIADSDLSNAVRCGLWCYLGRWFWVRLADVVLCLVGDLVKVSSLFCTFAFSVMTRMENDFSSNLVWHFCVFYTSWKWYGKKVGARWQLSVSQVICCYPPRTQEKVGGKQVKFIRSIFYSKMFWCRLRCCCHLYVLMAINFFSRTAILS